MSGRVCPAGECDGYGCAWTDPHTCTCGGPSPEGMHEPYCGSEPCPAGCEFVPRTVLSASRDGIPADLLEPEAVSGG